MMHKRKSRKTTKLLTEPEWAEWEKISNFNQLDLEYNEHHYICEDCREKHAFLENKTKGVCVLKKYVCKGFTKYHGAPNRFGI